MSTVKVSGRSGELSVEVDASALTDEAYAAAEQVAYSTLGELANKLSMLSDPSDDVVEAEASHTLLVDGTNVLLTGKASFRSAPGFVHVGVSEAVFRVATSIIMSMKPVDPARTMKLLGSMPQVAGMQPQMPAPQQPAPLPSVGDDSYSGGQYL